MLVPVRFFVSIFATLLLDGCTVHEGQRSVAGGNGEFVGGTEGVTFARAHLLYRLEQLREKPADAYFLGRYMRNCEQRYDDGLCGEIRERTNSNEMLDAIRALVTSYAPRFL